MVASSLFSTPVHSTDAETLPERTRLIDAIIEINRNATRDFLDDCKDTALRMYLDHLKATSQPRGPRAIWVRPADSPAIVVRESRH